MNWGIRTTVSLLAIVAGTLLAIVILFSFERPPLQSVQRGYRGVGMQENYNPRTLEVLAVANKVPGVLPSLGTAGPKAGTVYKNVKLLGGLSVGQFTRLMASITTWVSPKQGCAYCHDTKDMASDALYTKVVARRMIQMVQHVNADWKPHVVETGVTCYTCHRGQPVPANVWFENAGPPHAHGQLETESGMGYASGPAGLTALPYDPYSPFLEKDASIRVQATTALPSGNLQTIKQTEWTYALMMNISQSLGVNCTYCHNSREFGDWKQSTPQRTTAWHGIRMTRDLNNGFMTPLTGTFPPARLGPQGDVAKINCATCHQGVYKPLFGVSMVKTFPELRSVAP